MGSPIDRTAKTALDSNLVNGNVSDAPKMKANNDVIYNYSDTLNSAIDTHAASAILPHADSSVTEQKIRDGAVTTAKIADLAVTRPKLAVGAVGSSQLDPTLLTDFGDVAVQAEFDKRGINVQKFGAKGDYNTTTGIGTDDTAAIQAAIDYAEDNNLKLYVPRLNFKIAGSLQLRRSTAIESDSGIFYYTGNGTCILAEGTPTSDIYPNIRGLGVIKAGLDRVGVGMSVKKSRMGGHFVDCFISGFEYGVIHSDAAGTSFLNFFERCSFRYNKIGISLLVDSNGVTLNNCLVNNNTDIGVLIADAYNVRILNTEFESNGQKTGGHAISISHGISILIQGNYFEANGYTDTNSAVIHIGGYGTSYSYQPQIVSNYFNATGAHTTIKIVECQTVYITGNNFNQDHPPTYDIDIASMNSTIWSFIMGNRPSGSGDTKLNKAAINNSAWVQHGNSLFKQIMEIFGNNTAFVWHDDVNSSTAKIDHLNDKLRLFNKAGVNYWTFNGATQQATITCETGTTAQRASAPPAGRMYFDTTLGKPIWWNGSVWKDATGTTV